MIVDFKDGSFVEIKLAKTPGKICITLAAKDAKDPLKTNINSCNVSIQEFADMVGELNVQLVPKKK